MGGSVPNPNPNTNAISNPDPNPNPNSVNSKNMTNGIMMNGGSFSQHHHPHHLLHHQLRDTTLTKVFVGGLAWETQRDAMKRHFEQYGEILEAVVIMDKNTGRSKGYGFVTFRDPEAARRACMDATPVIDGRRANCNLASLGANQRPRTPVSNRLQVGLMAPYSSAANSHMMAGPTFVGNPAGAAPVYPPHHLFPNYQIYGYSPYMQDYGYNQGVYAPYGGVTGYPHVYGGGPTLYSPYPNMHFMQQPPAGSYPSTNTISSVSTSNGVASSPIPPSIAIPNPPLFHHHHLTTPNVVAEQPTS